MQRNGINGDLSLHSSSPGKDKMWSITSSRNKLAEVHKVTRRIVDSTVARHCFEDQRRDSRIARLLPVFVAVYDQKSGTIGDVSNAVTKDISDDGIGLLTIK